MLEDASIKLSSVASSMTTLSARVILQATIDGERDPPVLAQLARGRIRVKIPDLAQALEGHFDDHHAQMARAVLGRLDLVELSLFELDAVTAAKCTPWQHEIDLVADQPWGEKVAQLIVVAETGADMSRSPAPRTSLRWPV